MRNYIGSNNGINIVRNIAATMSAVATITIVEATSTAVVTMATAVRNITTINQQV
jgi:hypothetical protein